MAFQKYSEEKRNEILDSQQEKNARGKISLLLNLGFPKDWIEKMLPYINEDTTSWQLRMISLFDQDPEDLVAMLEDSVKNSSVEIFQSIRKKYYIEKKSSADIEQIQKSMEQYVPLIHNQLDAYNEMSALLQQQFAVQQEKDDLHKSKGDLQERINAMQKEHEKISIEKEDIFHQLQDSEKEKISIQQQLVDATESLQKSQGTAASYEKQIAILNNRIDELEKQLEVYQAKENEIAQEEEKQLEQIPVKRRIIWSSFFHDSKIKRKEELYIQEQAERERLAKEYIYDPSHSEEQAALFLDAAGTEEWTLEDLRTLAAQSDIDSMKILQRKIEQLHKASQKKAVRGFAPDGLFLCEGVSLRLAPCPAAGRAATLAQHQPSGLPRTVPLGRGQRRVFFAVYTPPQKTDWSLFAACAPRTL